MSRWHNKLGEGGQRLTILSVFPGASLGIAGEGGNLRTVLALRVHEEDEVEFTAEENLPVHELADRLYETFGADGQSVSVLRVLRPGDDPLVKFALSERPDTDQDASRGPVAALLRFREAVHRLFGGSAEQGTPPTVLSLLVNPTDAQPSGAPAAGREV
jgi:hypothetical protein